MPDSKRLTLATSAAWAFGRQVLVNDADAAFLRQRNRQTPFGNGIHGRGKQRQIESDVARQAGGQADIARQDPGMCRDEQDIVERQGFLQNSHGL